MKRSGKLLYKGVFNYEGEVHTMYRRAHSEESAFSLFTLALSRSMHLTTPHGIRNYFLTKSRSYKITEVL